MEGNKINSKSLVKCDCGAAHTEFSNFHSDWCSVVAGPAFENTILSSEGGAVTWRVRSDGDSLITGKKYYEFNPINAFNSINEEAEENDLHRLRNLEKDIEELEELILKSNGRISDK